MRPAWEVIRDSIHEQRNGGETLVVDAFEVVRALGDEGWHLVSTPQVERVDGVVGPFYSRGSELSMAIIVDDTRLNTAYLVTEQEMVGGREVVRYAKERQAYELALCLARTLGLPVRP